jgi:hypothetical protein
LNIEHFLSAIEIGRFPQAVLCFGGKAEWSCFGAELTNASEESVGHAGQDGTKVEVENVKSMTYAEKDNILSQENFPDGGTTMSAGLVENVG